MSDARADDAIIAGFEATLAGAAALDVVRDGEGRITDFVVVAVNPAAERLMGRAASDVIGRSAREVPALAAIRDPIADYAAVVETGLPLVDEFRLARPENRVGDWVHRYVSRTRTGLIVVIRDVSEDPNLRRSGDEFFEATDDLWCIVAADRTFVRVSSAFERLLGWREEDLIGRSSWMLIHPDDIPAAEREEARVRDGLPTRQIEIRTRHADGSYRRIIWSSVAVRGESHRYAVGRDVTEQRRVEEESQKRGALLEAVLNGTVDLVFVKNQQGRYILFLGNDVVHGLTPEQIVGKSDAEIAPDYAGLRERMDRQVMETGEAVMYEYSYMHDGERRTVGVTKAPYRGRDGSVIGVVGLGRDVTELRRLQAQVQQAQKMEAVGRLAGGIAHDFNNLLTAILSFATLAGETLPPDHPARADLAAIRRAGEGAAELTRQMLAFGRREVTAPRPLLVNDIVQSIDRLLRSLVGESVTLDLTLDPSLATVDADPSQIERVLVNLVVNAGHATADGGIVWIETANATVTPSDAIRLPGLTPGSYVRLTVRDTGVGMDEATRLRAFEPFFTTKPEGMGTGLGLSSVYGIVQDLRGAVFVDSRPGQGSTFAVYLPVAPAVAAEAAPKVAASAGPAMGPQRGHERVLLVEDNHIVRQAEERILREAGYDVYIAENGVAALCLAAALEEPFDLLITDLMMPEMGGRATLARLREDWPALPALLVSGYEPGDAGDAVTLPAGTAFLQKPFTSDALLRAVRTLLDRARKEARIER